MEFFWDKKDVPDVLRISDGLNLHRINDQTFLSYMAGCKGYSTTAGFESVCEALYLQKPVMMVPVHIEQICNAYDALKVGAGAVAGYFDLDVLLDTIPDYKPNECSMGESCRSTDICRIKKHL
ncbi:MAG: glycosyltransferase family protein [Barnesiella sp.]